MEFIQAHLVELIILALLLIGAIIYIAWLIKKKGLRQVAIDLIVTAEREFKKGENAEKFDFVLEKLTAKIPLPFSLFITKSSVEKFIQVVFDEIKEALDYKQK